MCYLTVFMHEGKSLYICCKGLLSVVEGKALTTASCLWWQEVCPSSLEKINNTNGNNSALHESLSLKTFTVMCLNVQTKCEVNARVKEKPWQHPSHQVVYVSYYCDVRSGFGNNVTSTCKIRVFHQGTVSVFSLYFSLGPLFPPGKIFGRKRVRKGKIIPHY